MRRSYKLHKTMLRKGGTSDDFDLLSGHAWGTKVTNLGRRFVFCWNYLPRFYDRRNLIESLSISLQGDLVSPFHLIAMS